MRFDIEIDQIQKASFVQEGYLLSRESLSSGQIADLLNVLEEQEDTL